MVDQLLRSKGCIGFSKSRSLAGLHLSSVDESTRKPSMRSFLKTTTLGRVMNAPFLSAVLVGLPASTTQYLDFGKTQFIPSQATRTG